MAADSSRNASPLVTCRPLWAEWGQYSKRSRSIEFILSPQTGQPRPLDSDIGTSRPISQLLTITRGRSADLGAFQAVALAAWRGGFPVAGRATGQREGHGRAAPQIGPRAAAQTRHGATAETGTAAPLAREARPIMAGQRLRLAASSIPTRNRRGIRPRQSAQIQRCTGCPYCPGSQNALSFRPAGYTAKSQGY